MPQKSNFGSPPAKPGVYLGEISLWTDSNAISIKNTILNFLAILDHSPP